MALLDTSAFTRECTARVLQSLFGSKQVLAFASAEELVAAYGGGGRISLILFNIGECRAVDPQIRSALQLLRENMEGSAVVVTSNHEDGDRVIEAIGEGVRGYIPPSTSLDVAVEAIRLVEAGGTYIPASSLTSLSERSNAGAPLNGSRSERDQFTPKQLAVLHLISKGKPNKVIAYELLISESTVKIHVRNIMQKLKATNRTEVAFRTRNMFGFLWLFAPVQFDKLTNFLLA